MKNILSILFLAPLLSLVSSNNILAQSYKENSGEIIFAFSDIERNNIPVPSKMRFTMFFHGGQNYHYDFGNVIGFFSGYGLRNIGIISEENDVTFKRRTYALGIPAAIKLGSFRDHVYIYGGGEYELFFHYRQKRIDDDGKSKHGEWFSERTERFVPSFFGGFQFPGGINLKLKYYPRDFLNREFQGFDFGLPVDYSEFNKSRLFYFSLIFNFKNKDLKKLYDPKERPGRIASLE